MKTKLRIISFFSGLIMALLCFTGCSPAAVIDGSKCVSVKFEGYNGDGTASVNVDYDYILSLLGDMNARTADSVAGSISAETIKESGSLSNGDTVTVKLKAKADVLENANVALFNTEIPFTVSGLKEKEKVDLFKNVEIKVNGTSPECSVSFSYTGAVGSPYYFTLKRADGKKTTEYYKNGDKLTVSLTDEAIERLKKEYIIEETSREYTVQADKKYILSADDLSDKEVEAFKKLSNDFVDNKVKDLDRDSNKRIISGVSGINIGALYASSTEIRRLDNIEFNSAYVGTVRTEGYFGNITEIKLAFFYYTMDITYHPDVLSSFDKEASVDGAALVVSVKDPVIDTNGEITYSEIAISAQKNIEAATNIPYGDFEKIA